MGDESRLARLVLAQGQAVLPWVVLREAPLAAEFLRPEATVVCQQEGPRPAVAERSGVLPPVALGEGLPVGVLGGAPPLGAVKEALLVVLA